MAGVTFEQVSKIYPDGTRAVNSIDLDIQDGEFMVLVGPSGCGKSTSLRMLAGLEEINAGAIHIGDRDVTDLPPKDRDIAMVFQNYALYPHMTVGENLSFGLRMTGNPRADTERRVAQAARILQIEPLLARRPKALSGGQRQRVAIGRAIVREPEVFLFDEPLSNLDAELRTQLAWNLSSFFIGEERVTTQFSGLVMAYESQSEEAFLTTQQVDEARHAQHFNRFYEQVLGIDGTFEDRLARADRGPDGERVEGGAEAREVPVEAERDAAVGPHRLEHAVAEREAAVERRQVRPRGLVAHAVHPHGRRRGRR